MSTSRLTSCVIDGDTFVGSFSARRSSIAVHYKGATIEAPIGPEPEHVTARLLLSELVREDLDFNAIAAGLFTVRRQPEMAVL